jgi:hypothetical protein
MHIYEVDTRQRTNILDMIRHIEKYKKQNSISCSLRCKSIEQVRSAENEYLGSTVSIDYARKIVGCRTRLWIVDHARASLFVADLKTKSCPFVSEGRLYCGHY